jgi:hypothetical protein
MPTMSKKHVFAMAACRVAVVVVGAAALSACSGDELTRTFGLVRESPDEFQVTTRAPLSMPPDYSLRPPRPGEARPQELSQQRAAEATLVPQAVLAGPTQGATSSGQQALLSAAGPQAPADIRKKLASETALDEPDQTLTERLMFWKAKPVPGVVVDPAQEASRLRENAALGDNPQAGDTPIIQRTNPKGTFFDSLF